MKKKIKNHNLIIENHRKMQWSKNGLQYILKVPMAKHSDMARTCTAQSIFDKTFGIIAVPSFPVYKTVV